MNGLAVAETDLGLPSGGEADDQLFCLREVPTGSHVPHWVCRYKAALDAEREFTRNKMEEARVNWLVPPQGSAMALGLNGGHSAGGSGGHTQSR
jgi:hypothetical protein